MKSPSTKTPAVVAPIDSVIQLVRGNKVAFTEHGAVMAATALNSERTVAISLHVVRAFVKLRETLAETKEWAQKLDELERKQLVVSTFTRTQF